MRIGFYGNLNLIPFSENQTILRSETGGSNISDNEENFDDNNYTLKVINTAPNITNNNKVTAIENEVYFVDYECDDEGIGET